MTRVVELSPCCGENRDGIWITDVVTRMVAESLGRPAPDYCHPKVKNQQEELPLARAS
jgi:hypothetical protein